MESIKTFHESSPFNEIEYYFKIIKKPFIVRNVIDSHINLDFLMSKFKDEEVISLNPNSDKEVLTISKLIDKISEGEKYRLRANTKKLMRKNDIKSYRADPRLAKKILNWRAKITFKQLIHKMVNDQLY